MMVLMAMSGITVNLFIYYTNVIDIAMITMMILMIMIMIIMTVILMINMTMTHNDSHVYCSFDNHI